jgi:20S proteasome subunit beta 5
MSQKLFNSLFNNDEDETMENDQDFSDSLNFKFANTYDPSLFVSELKQSNKKESKIADFMKGTTTLGFKFQGGVVLAVDSRASMGKFNSSESVRKVIEINDYLLGTMAGGAADCLFWEENLARILKIYELNNGERMSVAGASQLFSSMLFNYRGHGLSVGTMIAGSDDKGTHLYYCDQNGNRIKGDIFSIGSGGSYAMGVLDTNYHYNLSLEEAVELGKRAISEATYMDSGSGGVVRVYHVHEKGWDCLVDAMDNNDLIWKRKQNDRDFFGKALIN